MSNLTKTFQEIRLERRRELLNNSAKQMEKLPSEIQENDLKILDMVKFSGLILGAGVGACSIVFTIYVLAYILAP